MVAKAEEEEEAKAAKALKELKEPKHVPTTKVDALAVSWEKPEFEKEGEKEETPLQEDDDTSAVAASVLARFTPAALFKAVGVSKALAGDRIYKKVVATCQTEDPDFKFNHEVACVHVIKEKQRALRKRLMTTGGVGPYPRALCASWDIQTRKTMAGIPTDEDNGGIGVFKDEGRKVNAQWISTFESTLAELRKNKEKQIEQLTNFDIPCEPFFSAAAAH